MNELERWVHGWVEHRPRLRRRLVTAYQWLLSALPASQWIPEGATRHEGYFFGFHNKSPWSADGRHLLAHRFVGDGREPSTGSVEVGVLDPHCAGSFRRLAETCCWNWQQGSDLQWRGRSQEVVVNDLEASAPCARVLDLHGVELGRVRKHVAAIAPDGCRAASIDFARLARGMPGYGYEADRRGGGELCEVRVLDLERDTERTILSLPGVGERGHRFASHTSFSRDGEWLAFFVRERSPSGRLFTELWSAEGESAPTRVPLDDCSHYAWCADGSLLAYCRPAGRRRWCYSRIDCGSGAVDPVSWLGHLSDGHPGACDVPGRIVSDTYPDRRRLQRLMLFDLERATVTEVARLRIPLRFRGRVRCDFHPRLKRDGSAVCFDSAHTGTRSLVVVPLPANDCPNRSPR